MSTPDAEPVPPRSSPPPSSRQTSPQSETAQTSVPPRRRVWFPWVWLGLLVGGWTAAQVADIPVDFKELATMAGVLLAVFGLGLWYAVRGRASLPVRLAVGAAPFVAFATFNAFFELRHRGDGRIVGIHRRGVAKADEQLAKVAAEASDEGLADWGPGELDYPGFLGAGPWAEVSGVQLAADWTAEPPQELWRRPVGAGWSSFAIFGRYAVTQEQRGAEELVVCYECETGEPAWSHADPVRFDPQDLAGQMGRVGPRGTPTIVGDRVYTHGAEGLVNCLEARTGAVVWSVDTADRYGIAPLVWGKSGSPLHVQADKSVERALIVIGVGAPATTDEASHDASLVAFDAETGDEVWRSGWRQTSYASPQLVTLDGSSVVLHVVDDTLVGHAAVDGQVLFEHPWWGKSNNAPSCSQPIAVADDRLLLTKGYGRGASLIQVSRDGDAWSTEPVWSPAVKSVLQTKFSNVVLRGGHAYGLNGDKLECVELESGKRAWRKRRRPAFGFGQVMLVGEHLLVVTEAGEVVLVSATPDEYRELAAMQVLDRDETCWNNPALAGDLLLVRNSVEAAAYRLPTVAASDDETAAADPLAQR